MTEKRICSSKKLFSCFANYNPSVGLTSVLGGVDASGLAPYQIYLLALGRLPERAEVAVPTQGYDSAEHLLQILGSDEFQTRIFVNIMRTYTDKKKIMFLHIPKCGGSSILQDLSASYPVLTMQMTDQDWNTKEQFYRWLSIFIKNLREADFFFVHGHVPLGVYNDESIFRMNDTIFTVIRSPIERLVSMINYVMTIVAADPDLMRPDTRKWIEQLSLGSNVVADLVAAEPLTMARKLVQNEAILGRNTMCHYLGNGTYKSACEQILSSNNVSAWMKHRWGISAGSRVNPSVNFIRNSDLTDDDLSTLYERNCEDIKLHETLILALRETSSISFMGLGLNSYLPSD